MPQVQALVAWVENGGHLAVGIEQVTDVNSTPWLRNLLPCTLASMSEIPVGDVLKAWLQGAAPPPAVQEPARRQRTGPVAGTFTMPAPSARTMQGIVVTVTPSGLTYTTNNAARRDNRFVPQQFWVSNNNGTVTRMTASAFSNFLELRGLATTTTPPTAATNTAGGAATNAEETVAFESAPLQVAVATARDGKYLIGDAGPPRWQSKPRAAAG